MQIVSSGRFAPPFSCNFQVIRTRDYALVERHHQAHLCAREVGSFDHCHLVEFKRWSLRSLKKPKSKLPRSWSVARVEKPHRQIQWGRVGCVQPLCHCGSVHQFYPSRQMFLFLKSEEKYILFIEAIIPTFCWHFKFVALQAHCDKPKNETHCKIARPRRLWLLKRLNLVVWIGIVQNNTMIYKTLWSSCSISDSVELQSAWHDPEISWAKLQVFPTSRAMATGEFLPAVASAGDTEQFRQEVEALEAEESEET